MQQKVPFSLIRCSSSKAKGAFCSCVAWGWRIYNIVESESDPLTRRSVDLWKKNPSRANGRSTYIQPPSLTKIRQRTSEEIGNTQTNKCCLNYSMMMFCLEHKCIIFGQHRLLTIKYLTSEYLNIQRKKYICLGIYVQKINQNTENLYTQKTLKYCILVIKYLDMTYYYIMLKLHVHIYSWHL